MHRTAPKPLRRRRARRGSALVMVLIFTITLSVVAASMLHRVTTENRISHAHFATLRARNTLDAVMDYGIGQMVKRRQVAASDPDNIYSPEGAAPLATPTPASFDPAGTALDRTDFAHLDVCAASGERVLSADLVNTGKFFVDPLDEDNEKDPLRGQYISRHLTAIIARGAVSDPLSPGALKFAHGFALVERRDGFMFNYAVFFSAASLRVRNLNKSMAISGPTYSNKDMFITLNSGSQSQLSFDGTLSIAGTLGNKWSRPGTSTFLRIRKDGGVFDYKNNVGAFNLQTNADGSLFGVDRIWTDADGEKFTTLADNNGGYLQTKSHGVQPIYPVGTTAPSDSPTVVTDPRTGAAYTLESERTIDPPRKGVLDASDSAAGADPALAAAKQTESSKIALKASLYLLVEQSDGSSGTNAQSRVIAFNDPSDAIDYKALSSASSRAKWLAANENKVINVSSVVAVPSSIAARPVRKGLNAGGKEVTLKSLPTQTLYDPHQKSTVSTVTLDLAALSSAIRSGSLAFSDGSPWNVNDKAPNDSAYADAESTKGWNGILYVDVERPDSLLSGSESLHYANDPTTGADPGKTALRVINGETLPTSSVGTPGFTLATNAAVYVKGNYNADGDMDTGSSRAPDSASEKAAAIWADYVTTLSPAHDDLKSLVVPVKNVPSGSGWDANDLLPGNWPFQAAGTPYTYNTGAPVSANIEIAAAIVSGDSFDDASITSSGTQGTGTSNGLQNFIPQIEYFNTDTSKLRIRGSLVNLWAPKYFTGVYRDAYFKNPTRDFGYSATFQSGAMPPGTPAIRMYRKLRYREISRDVYEKLRDDTPRTTKAWIGVINALDSGRSS